MAFFDFFKKKTEEEQFEEASRNQDYTKLVNLGKKLLKKHPESLAIFNPYVSALIKLNREQEAIKELISFAKRKIAEEYYDVAITFLNKALKLNPFNLETIRLLSDAYIKKELLYEAFEVLVNSFERFVEAGRNPVLIKELLDKFVENYFHPIFYERYADVLVKSDYKEDAFNNYVIAGNLYMNLGRVESALKAFLKARDLKVNNVIDKQIIEVISHIREEKPEVLSLLSLLIQKYGKKFDFIEYTISKFKENNNLQLLEKAVEKLKNPLLKYTYLSLIKYELGKFEDAEVYLNKVRLLDKELYDVLESYMLKKDAKIKPLLIKEEEKIKEEEEEIPEPEEILEVLDGIIGISESPFESSEDLIEKNDEFPHDIKAGIEFIQNNTDGKRLISMAEAFLGLGNYKEAEKFAKQALETEEKVKAAILAAESIAKQGREKEAISLLLDILKENLSPVEKAQVKVELGEIYYYMGDKERALHWYKSANEILKDPEIEEKIRKIEKGLG